MGIWYDLYRKRSPEFVEGVIAGVEMYAIWRNGLFEVGTQKKPLKEVVRKIKEDLLEDWKSAT